MSSFYDNLTLTAANLLKRYGQKVTFTRTVVGDYNVSDRQNETSTIKFKGYGAPLKYESREIDGTQVQAGDLKLIAERLKKRPILNDLCEITVDGTKELWTVQKSSPLAPGGSAVIYVCQLRKGIARADRD